MPIIPKIALVKILWSTIGSLKSELKKPVKNSTAALGKIKNEKATEAICMEPMAFKFRPTVCTLIPYMIVAKSTRLA